MYHQDDNYLENPPHKNMLTQSSKNSRDQEQSYTLEVALPGCNDDDIQVDINDGKLIIRAFIRQGITDEDDFLRREEPDRGIRTRTFLLPSDIDTQRIVTKYKNGLLKITFFKMDIYPCLN
jgi:HSP20 family protein